MTAKRSKPQSNGEPDPSDIGSQLKRRRTLRGQSLEAVHQHTRIPREHLEALEANNFDYFPASVYMRGFLRSYCEYLDIDCDPLLENLDSEKSKIRTEAKAPKTPLPWDSSPLWLPFSSATLMPFLLIAGLAMAGVLLWTLKEKPTEEPSRARAPQGQQRRRPVKEITVVLKALQTVNLSLEADGKVVFEGRLHTGQAPSFTGKGFVLKTSNKKALQVLVNGNERPWSSLTASSKDVYPITLGER